MHALFYSLIHTKCMLYSCSAHVLNLYAHMHANMKYSMHRWVDALEEEGESPDSSKASSNRAMWVYIGVSLAVIAAILARSLFQSFASLRASIALHDSMARRVMRAPMGWFERTPLGRVLNRFSSDIQEIDKVGT